MRTIYLSFVLLLLVIASSCGSDSSNNPIGPGGSVTFTMAGQGDPTSYTFGFQSSVDVKITRIIASLPAQGFFDTLNNNNTNYVFSKDTVYTLDPYIGVNQGQAWTFYFTGSTASNNTAYSTSSNFTVP